MSFLSEKKVKSMMEQSGVAGLSLTYLKGQPCGVDKTYSWGMSDLSNKERVTPLTRFQMASMSKVVPQSLRFNF